MEPSHISSTNDVNPHDRYRPISEGSESVVPAKFPTIVGISMVKNEQDVIEPFVRHNIRLLDHLIVLDNGSVDETRRILTALAQEFPNLVVLDDKQFGYTQSERMTYLLHQCQASFAADYVIPLDADEFLDSADRTSLYEALGQIPRGGYGLVPWCTFVLTPGSVDAPTNDSPRTMVWRRRQELPSYQKAILHLGGVMPIDLLIEQGNHAARSTSGRQIPAVMISGLRLLHYPVRSRDQVIAKSVVGWMAYLAMDPQAVKRGQGVHWHANFKRIANGHSIDPVVLCEMSLLYAQSPRTVDWEGDVVQETPQFNYERRYSTGKCLGSIELIVRSWEQSVTDSRIVPPSDSKETTPSSGKLATNNPETNIESVPVVNHGGDVTCSTEISVSQLIQEGKPNEAAMLLNAAITQGETAELWNDWATVQHGCGQAGQAECGYRRALDLDGSCRQAAVNLGLMLFGQGRWQEAMPLLERHKSTLTVEEKQAIRELAGRVQTPSDTPAAKTNPSAARGCQQAGARKNRRAFIDLGANVGKISFEYAKNNPDCDIYCVEPTRELIKEINDKSFQAGRTFVTMWAAAWTYDGTINLFSSGASEASTIVGGKVEINNWPQIDYENSHLVPCFDFSAWLMRTFNLSDHVTVKMDIEGAEYDLLEKMIADRSILLVNELVCEWHYDRYPNISVERHNAIRNRVRQLTSLKDWR
jgi:FkbM family methyltransferase